MPATPPPRGIDGILDTLRRAQRELARNPRAALRSGARQLLSGSSRPRSSDRSAGSAARTYRIDDLARVSNVTVRNIRAYQERGLLHPPERVGRVALFDDTHVSRLKIITSMLERGYTSGHITEMLGAWEAGRDLGDVLGLEHALVPARLEDPPTTVGRAQALELAGGEENALLLADAGLLRFQDERVRLERPGLLRAFAEMRKYSVPTEDMIRLHLRVSHEIDQITRDLVAEGVRQLQDRFTSDGRLEPEGTEIADLVGILTRFRTLAMTSVTATLAESMEKTIEEVLTAYLAQFLPADTDAG